MNLGKEVRSVSILISTKNRLHDLKECIDSILLQTVKPDEIILVDASDTCISMEMVNEILVNTGIKLTYYRQDVISGKVRKTATWNKAVRLALGDIIIFLDDDVVLNKHYIYHILKTYHESPGSVVGVMGRFKNPKEDNATQERPSFLYLLSKFIYKLFLLPHETGSGVMQPSGFPEYPSSKNDVTHVEIMPAGNMGIKKEVFEEFTFDEWFHGYSYQEDDDFTYRVSRKYKFLYTPFAALVHKSSTSGRDSIETVETMKVVNHYYFFKKNMPKSLKNWLAFVWSEFGLLFLRCFSFSSLRNLSLSLIGLTVFKNFSAIKGRIRGYNRILKSLLLNKSIEY
ncbi:MAG TPA: glycosyltransferase family 2 protein [Candidatus Wunengus sp. YC60]|uniref:glycosyltransferase family 2 protein n=1 Tax=Candidatus Wunengus sp. YC60 TaxID=3367697 RepID=UPI004029145E